MKTSLRLSFLLAGFLLAGFKAQAVADFTGHWRATNGKVSSTIGITANCSRVEITIRQTATALLTEKYESDCGLYGSNWGPVKEDLHGSQVSEQGTVVGSISDTTLKTVSQDGGINYAYNLRLIAGPNGQPQMESYYGTQNGAGAIVIEATLEKIGE